MEAVIQLSDQAVHAQAQSEPRMEALAFTQEYDRHIDGAWKRLQGGDLLGVARELQAMRRMTTVAYQRIDELTLQVAGWEDGPTAA